MVEQANEREDMFQVIVTVLLAVVATVSAISTAWATLIADQAGSEDFAGLQAIISREDVRISSEALVYENLRVYTDFVRHKELQRLYTDAIRTRFREGEAIPPDLSLKNLQSMNIASNSRFFFFQSEFINPDGSYNAQRQLEGLIAEAASVYDMQPEPHFRRSQALRLKSRRMTFVFVGLGFSMFFYTVAQALHPGRQSMRYVMAAGATILFMASVAAMLFIGLQS